MMPFPWIRQLDSMQCGAACLAMVCRHYGHGYPVEYLSELCSVSREGVSLLGISKAAQALGFETMCVKIGIERMQSIPMPCILHWNQNHFVVLYKVTDKYFYISDPGKGRQKLTRADFESHWLSGEKKENAQGIALLFEPGPEFGKTEVPPEIAQKKGFGFLIGYIRRFRRHFALIALTMLVGSGLQLILPFLMQAIVDKGIKNSNLSIIWLIMLGELMIVAGVTISDFVRRRVLLNVSMKVNISLVSDFFVKLLRLPMAFFDTKLMGDLLQRIGDHSRIQSFLTGETLGLFFSVINFVVFSVVMCFYSPLIFGVFMIGSTVYGIWIALFLRRRKVLDYETFEVQARNSDNTYQFVTAMQEIKLQSCEQRRLDEWQTVQYHLFDVQLKALRLQQMQESGSVLINEIKNIFITVLAATAVINGEMTFGAMLAMQYIIGQLNAPVERLMGFVYTLQDVRISLERINEVHMASNEESVASAGLKSFVKPEDGLRMKGLHFKYDKFAPTDTIDGVDMHIERGKVTAIVGASGSGKTTLMKILLGYYRPYSGAVEIAGENIDSYNLKWWRSQCGAVMQDGVIFSESIGRNIAVGDGEVDMERVRHAAQIACIDEDVMRLPLKYETKVGRDGAGLSVGQKQRLLIARAVYKNPDFIFLDEATNSLDAANERAIVENLAEFYRGRTVVIVAHRLSTVRKADLIVVLDHGKVVEQGTHETLVARRGKYYNLVKNQLELGN